MGLYPLKECSACRIPLFGVFTRPRSPAERYFQIAGHSTPGTNEAVILSAAKDLRLLFQPSLKEIVTSGLPVTQ